MYIVECQVAQVKRGSVYQIKKKPKTKLINHCQCGSTSESSSSTMSTSSFIASQAALASPFTILILIAGAYEQRQPPFAINLDSQ